MLDVSLFCCAEGYFIKQKRSYLVELMFSHKNVKKKLLSHYATIICIYIGYIWIYNV